MRRFYAKCGFIFIELEILFLLLLMRFETLSAFLLDAFRSIYDFFFSEI